jgi:hypothetical protein
MLKANERQVGGNHYKGAEYQHWDYVSDCRLHYLAGVASKYVSRSRRKDGIQDLEKGIHYIDKAEELAVTGSIQTHRMSYFWRFVTDNSITMHEAQAIWYIQEGEWEAARLAVKFILENSCHPPPR